MERRLKDLFKVLNNVPTGRPPNLAGALDSLPPPAALPAPITSWLLVVLLRYHKRQEWARVFIRERLPRVCPPGARLCRRTQPVHLPVPKMPDWRVVLHADEQFAHLVSDRPPQLIRVDVSTDRANDFVVMSDLPRGVPVDDRWSPEWRWKELVTPLYGRYDVGDWPEVDVLVEAGLLDVVDVDEERLPECFDGDAYRLTKLALVHAELVSRVFETIKSPGQFVMVAAAVGDWECARSAAFGLADDETLALIERRVEECDNLTSDIEYVNVVAE